MARIVSVQTCPAPRAPMQLQQAVRAVENFGLEGDRHARSDSQRQVLLLEEETLSKFDLAIGITKENITTRGIALMSLEAGTRLQVGNAVLELTKPCAPCARMDEIRMGLQAELQGQRGMLARVARGGEICVGDEIRVLSGDAK